VTADILGSSFRDPSGFVFRRDGVLYRQVNESFRPQFDFLIESGLYRSLTEQGLMVSHQEADLSTAAAPGAYRVLRPDPVPFVSYPYEWCFGQLKAAALATLEIQERAVEHGMSLRDASAYNIQFRAGRPVLIDTLSFERLREGEPWVAYRQFCQHFLAPLALMCYRDIRLGQLLKANVDGIPLDLAAELLPRRARLHPPLLLHIVGHAKSQARHGGSAAADLPKARRKGFSAQALRGLLSSLQSGVRHLEWRPDRSAWAGYYGDCEAYTPDGLAQKRELIEGFLDQAGPRSVWDLGGNTGMFGRIASDRGIATVCFEADPSCVEAAYADAVSRGDPNLLPLVMDLANPSPGIGWANRERMSLAERGPTDMAFALALVHHLTIGNNVPLDRLAEWLRTLCSWLAIEFVPKSDPQVQLLLASREDVFPHYTADGFERSFASAFTIERKESIPASERVLYLMRGR
jgi:hypothetical protein